MSFSLGTVIIIAIVSAFVGLILGLFMFCSGTYNKEEEAYQKGYIDVVNSVKKENE